MKSETLSPLMEGVLRALAEIEKGAGLYDYPATPNAIGRRMGLDRPTRTRGPWSGNQGEAQRIIFPLTALRNRGLVDQTNRPDGMSGTAYGLADEGRAWLEAT